MLHKNQINRFNKIINLYKKQIFDFNILNVFLKSKYKTCFISLDIT